MRSIIKEKFDFEWKMTHCLLFFWRRFGPPKNEAGMPAQPSPHVLVIHILFISLYQVLSIL